MKATVTTVKLGNLEFEGLMLDSGEYAISAPQINQLISLSASNNTISRDLKRLLGEGFSPSKVKIESSKQLINAVLLPHVESLLFETSLTGNQKAIDLSRQLIGLSLHQLFSDAFGVKFEKEDRQEWLKKRQATKRSFWFLTDAIKHWLNDNPSPNGHFVYSNTFNALNKGLFGKSAKEIKLELGIGKGELNRDHFGELALQRIDYIQALAEPAIYKGRNPIDAVKEALAAYDFENIEYTA